MIRQKTVKENGDRVQSISTRNKKNSIKVVTSRQSIANNRKSSLRVDG